MTVTVAGSLMTVVVEDDGVGLGEPARRSGLANLRQRAEDRSGEFSILPAESGSGTRITWQVPIE